MLISLSCFILFKVDINNCIVNSVQYFCSSVFPRDKLLALINLSQLDHLNEEVNEVTKNATYSSLGDVIYGLLSEIVVSIGEASHFDQAKGLMFIKYFLNTLLQNPAVKKIVRNREELLAFTNHMLHTANNYWDLIQWIQNLSSNLPFMKQLSVETENFMSFPAQSSLSPKFKEIIPELLTSVVSAFLLKHTNIIVGMQRLLHILF